MPYHTTLAIPPRTWTALTNAAVTGLRAQVCGANDVQVQATATNVAPGATAQGGALLLRSGPAVALLPSDLLSDLFPGVTGAAWLWAWCEGSSAISVSHA